MPKLSLKDVKPRIVEVTVKNESIGQEWLVEIALPTLTEWNNALFGIEFPNLSNYSRQRMKNGQKEDYLDVNDPEYLQLRDLAQEKVNMRRVTQALLGAGNFDELQDMSLEQATEELVKKSDRDFLRGVFQAMMQLMNGTKGSAIDTKRAAFPRVSSTTPDHDDLREKASLP